MDLATILNRSLGRLALEALALKEVCACQYYDLADNLDCTSTSELMQIINHNYACEMCGLKGDK